MDTCKYAQYQPVRIESAYYPSGFVGYTQEDVAVPRCPKERRGHRRHVERRALEQQEKTRAMIQRLVEWPWCGVENKPVELVWSPAVPMGLVAARWLCPYCSKLAKETAVIPPPAPPPMFWVPRSALAIHEGRERCLACGVHVGDHCVHHPSPQQEANAAVVRENQFEEHLMLSSKQIKAIAAASAMPVCGGPIKAGAIVAGPTFHEQFVIGCDPTVPPNTAYMLDFSTFKK